MTYGSLGYSSARQKRLSWWDFRPKNGKEATFGETKSRLLKPYLTAAHSPNQKAGCGNKLPVQIQGPSSSCIPEYKEDLVLAVLS